MITLSRHADVKRHLTAIHTKESVNLSTYFAVISGSRLILGNDGPARYVALP
jgi:hypothetical protein